MLMGWGQVNKVKLSPEADTRDLVKMLVAWGWGHHMQKPFPIDANGKGSGQAVE